MMFYGMGEGVGQAEPLRAEDNEKGEPSKFRGSEMCTANVRIDMYAQCRCLIQYDTLGSVHLPAVEGPKLLRFDRDSYRHRVSSITGMYRVCDCTELRAREMPVDVGDDCAGHRKPDDRAVWRRLVGSCVGQYYTGEVGSGTTWSHSHPIY